MMLLNIAWRNIWRNKRRSIIVLSSIAIGLVAIILNEGLSIGMVTQIFDNQIGTHVSFLQIHHTGFNDNKIVQNSMEDPTLVEHALRESPDITAYSPRVLSFGLLSSAQTSAGGYIVGIDPAKERHVTTIHNSVVDGKYLEGRHREILIGKKLAEKLDIGVGDKLVGMASTIHGSVGSALFRVAGVFETVSSEFDRSFVYVTIEDLQEMLEMEKRISEFAVITSDRNTVNSTKAKLAERLGPQFEVLTYADLLPLMLAQIDIYEESMYIVYVIVSLAMIFGIINTMLMSVFERIKEFGVLTAVGMSSTSLFSMVLLEALLLGMVGTALGLLIGVGIHLPLSATGINLSKFSEGLTSFGVGTIIYPVLDTGSLLRPLIIIPAVAVLGAIYPAMKAARFEPMVAMRYV